jgi:hypothetical protein
MIMVRYSSRIYLLVSTEYYWELKFPCRYIIFEKQSPAGHCFNSYDQTDTETLH